MTEFHFDKDANMTTPSTPQTLPSLADDQIAMLKRDIYDISSGEFYATAEEAQLIVEAVLAITAQPQVAVPAIPGGWQIVPIEPTPEMLDAGCPIGEQVDHFDMKTVYAAMLAVAPQPPAGQQGRGEEPERQKPPQLLTDMEIKSLQELAEAVWDDLQKNQLGGYSGGNRPFYLLWMFKTVIERYGYRDVGLNHSRDALDEAYERGKNDALIAPATASEATAAQQDGWREIANFALSAEQIDKLRTNSLKPEEISGAPDVQLARIHELVHWFARLADGNANPKWLRGHAFELAYYIATADVKRGINLKLIRDASFKEGAEISQADRATLERLGVIKVVKASAAPANGEVKP